MGRISDGASVDLASVRAELVELDRQAEALNARRELLRTVLDFGMAEAAADAAADAAAPAAIVSPGTPASTTREVILAVMATLPPGTELKTSELHARMVADHGYGSTSETVRKAAQRMAGRGLILRPSPGSWAPAPRLEEAAVSH